MKLGVVADVHGNLAALEAVVADAETVGVDKWWALGDLVLFGPRPVETMQLLLSLPGVEFVRGNTDRYVVTGDQPHPHATPEDAVGDPDLVLRYGAMAAGIGWTRGVLVQAEMLDPLERLGDSVRAELPDGSRLLGVHASPGSDDGAGINSSRPDDFLRPLFAGCEADIVVGGHSHDPTDRWIDGMHLVNGGSVGLPRHAGHAGWLLIDASDDAVEIARREAPFDVESVIDELHRRRQPNADFIQGILRQAHDFAG